MTAQKFHKIKRSVFKFLKEPFVTLIFISSILLDYQMKLDRRLIKLKNKKKHFIICGWKPDFEQILEGIIKANPQVDTNSIIAVNTAP